MEERIQKYIDMGVQLGMGIGTKILGAIVLWIVGRIIIRMVLSMLEKTSRARKLDETVVRYINSSASALLNIVLVITVLSVFGVETTTFAGVLAAAGVAIGMAWSGLLSNLAAGVFLVVLRPFKVGDFITAGGVTGTVQSISLFVTTIDTPDNVRTMVGNAKIFSDTIQNFSTNSYRRVELTAQISGGADVEKAIERMKERLAKIPNVAKTPKPDVEIVTFTGAGPVLAVRPYCHNDHYWGVYFATNKAIQEEFSKPEYPAPGQLMIMKQISA